MKPRCLCAAVLAVVLNVASTVAESPRIPPVEDLPGPDWRGVLDFGDNNVIGCGNLSVFLGNWGLVGSLPGGRFPYSTLPSAMWPSGSGVEYLWSSGLWVGAIRNGQKHVSSVEDFEFRPGRGPEALTYTAREGDLGGRRFPGAAADDDGDGLIDEDWLNGRDDDGDGLVDEDFAAISNRMFVAEFRDNDPLIHLYSQDHQPLGLRVVQTALCWEDTDLDDFIGFQFEIFNDGIEPLEDVYVGWFQDADIGRREKPSVAEDDLFGFWEGMTETRLGTVTRSFPATLGYMFDDDGDAGSAEGYIGFTFLGALDNQGSTLPSNSRFRVHNVVGLVETSAFNTGGMPNNDTEAYHLLAGETHLSLPPPGDAPRNSFSSQDPDDYKFLMSIGPFPILPAGQSIRVNAALMLGEGFEGLLRTAAHAQLTFDGAWLDCDQNPLTGILGRETLRCEPVGTVVRLDPCDPECDDAPLSDRDCYDLITSSHCVWVNADCEGEDEIGVQTGIGGRECLVPWVAAVAPPPPVMHLRAKERAVEIIFNNHSETTPDFLTGEFDFESYRIWRAQGWTRPTGTTFETGPGNDLFELLAEFDIRNGIGSDTGLEALRHTPDVPRELIEYYREWIAAHPEIPPPDLPGHDAETLRIAKEIASGVRFYRFVDPPFKSDGIVAGPCPSDGECPRIPIPGGFRNMRCNPSGLCQETLPPPHPGLHYFYAVTAADHRLTEDGSGTPQPSDIGLQGRPNSNFAYVSPPTSPTFSEQFPQANERIYVVPNPANRSALAPWELQPNRGDATGIKIEFRHLPAGKGHVSIFTLSGDLVRKLPFHALEDRGTLAWNLLNRNGQEITSGVYLYVVESETPGFKTFVDKFVVIR